MRRPLSRLSDRELDIMDALWERGWSTVADVHQALRNRGHDLAYTTVQTMLNRLQVKGQLVRNASSKTHRYRPVLKKRAATTAAVRRLTDRFFQGSAEALVTHLVARNLDEKELDRLEAFIDTHRHGGGKS